MPATRLSVVVLAVSLVLAWTLPAFGTDEPATDDATATTAADVGSVAPPAVTVPPPATDDAPADWTYRYLIPTLLALALVVVIFTTVQYFLQVVRKRYKVVE